MVAFLVSMEMAINRIKICIHVCITDDYFNTLKCENIFEHGFEIIREMHAIETSIWFCSLAYCSIFRPLLLANLKNTTVLYLLDMHLAFHAS